MYNQQMKSVKIIPAINARSFIEVKNKIKLVKPYADWIHLDVADGRFTPNTTWHNPKDLLKLKNPPKIEVHLMINNIDKKIQNWLILPVKRIIFHLEGARNPDLIIKKIKATKKQAGISINPETSVLKLVPYFGKVNFFQILGVNPGKAGQKFQKKVLNKVRFIRKNCLERVIEGDGGMRAGTAKKMVKAGANLIVSASAIFDKPDVKKAIQELKSEIRN